MHSSIRESSIGFGGVMIMTVILGSPAGPAWNAHAQPIQGDRVGWSGLYRGESGAVRFDISPPLGSIPAPALMAFQPVDQDRPTGLEGPFGPQSFDPALQGFAGPVLIPAPIVSFNGPGNIAGVVPPDPVGDVGPNHYVVMTNLYFEVFDKTGVSLLGPLANNTLWVGFGGACETENAGSPIVLYDQLADRWLLTQFTTAGPTYFNCVALSTSPDPTGSYFRWAFSTGMNFPDFPKYGVWPDAYYISTREFLPAGPFAGVGAYALDRAQMIAGNPSPQVISFLVPPGGTPYLIGDGLLPADWDGFTPPPGASPEFYLGTMDDGGPYGAPQDALTLWKFTADFMDPPSSSFVLTDTLPTDPFDSIFPCAPNPTDCIPQPSTAQKLDHRGYRQRAMWRLAYRNYGSFESLMTNQSVEAGAGSGISGIRWYEIRSPNTSPVIHQQGTYAPGLSDGIHRWMGSIAMDISGNAALGFSASNSSVFPSIYYTGRKFGDPLGMLPQGEEIIITGTGSQTSPFGRWGDYTSMNVDPVDDCTFWYVNEYVPVTSSTDWQTRIGAFKFPTCGRGVVVGPSAGGNSLMRRFTGP